jgi:hypothetical protein
MNKQIDLIAINVTSGQHLSCAITISESADSCLIAVSIGETEIVYGEGYDFELALQILRTELEARGLHLLCNRYRRNAYVTPISRQMSRGLDCYLVRPKRPVDPNQIVDCLGAAKESDVVSAEAADAFIAKWKARPPVLALPILVWRHWRDKLRG